jgi:2-keto-3-deoxy-galactonokinase
MMAYVKIEKNVVVQKQPNEAEGFEEAPDSVVCGMVREEDGTFSAPPVDPAPARLAEIDAELHAIDAASARPIRALLVDPGSQSDKNKLLDLEARVADLRAERARLA